jgi:hypothetical protein
MGVADAQVGTQLKTFTVLNSDEAHVLSVDTRVTIAMMPMRTFHPGPAALVFAYMIWLTYFPKGMLSGTTANLVCINIQLVPHQGLEKLFSAMESFKPFQLGLVHPVIIVRRG